MQREMGTKVCHANSESHLPPGRISHLGGITVAAATPVEGIQGYKYE